VRQVDRPLALPAVDSSRARRRSIALREIVRAATRTEFAGRAPFMLGIGRGSRAVSVRRGPSSAAPVSRASERAAGGRRIRSLSSVFDVIACIKVVYRRWPRRNAARLCAGVKTP
jgi:hypothetical protein